MDKLPNECMILADENQMDIVVRNLISNAIKFTPSNGLITLEAEEMERFWKVKIRDTGIGMDKLTKKKIFKESSNITTYGTNNEKGTGLGLSLCKEMVKIKEKFGLKVHRLRDLHFILQHLKLPKDTERQVNSNCLIPSQRLSVLL